MLELDYLISINFSPVELRLVRYCDDIIFFIKNEDVLKKLKKLIAEELEPNLNISFHKDEKSGKTFQDTRSQYVEKRLAQDLYKYQIKFEAELASIDPIAKQDLVKLIHDIFGDALDKFLSNEHVGNIKDLERAINALSWKVPKLYDNNDEVITDSLKELCMKILVFLENEYVSHKMRANLMTLLISVLSFYGKKFTDVVERTVALFTSDKIQNGSRFCLIIQLQSFLSFNTKNIFQAKLHNIVTALIDKQSSVEVFRTNLIPGLKYKVEKSNQKFSFDLWRESTNVLYPNMASYLKTIQNAKDNINSLNDVFFNADSSAIFYSKYLISHVVKNYSEMSVEHRCALYKISRMFLIPDLEMLFVKDLRSFSELDLLTDDEKIIADNTNNSFSDLLISTFGSSAKEMYVAKRINDVNIYSDGKDYFIINDLRPLAVQGVVVNKIIPLIKIINELNVGEVRLSNGLHYQDNYLVYKLPSSKSLNHWLYIDASNTVDDILEVEKNFLVEKNEKLPEIVFSAKNLGIFTSGGRKHLYLYKVIEILIDTLLMTYKFSDNNMMKIINPGSALLPGNRLNDFLTVFSNVEIEEIFGKVGKRTVNYLMSNSVGSFYYRHSEKVLSILQDLDSYKFWLVQDMYKNRQEDELKNLSYEVFDLYYSSAIHIQASLPEVKKVSLYGALFKVQKISQNVIVKINKESNLKEILINIDEYDNIRKMKFKSIDELIGYSICSAVYCSLYNERKGLSSEVLFLGLIGAAWLHNSLVELKNKYAIDDYDKVISFLHNNRTHFNLTFKENYPYPMKELPDSVILKYTDFFEKLKKLLSDAGNNDLKCHQISKSSYFKPVFSNDKNTKLNEISANFKSFQMMLIKKPSGFVETLIQICFEKIGKDIGEEHYLYKIFSYNHKWRTDTDEVFYDKGYVLSLEGKHVMSIYPKFLDLTPINSNKILKVKERWIDKAVIVFIIFFISFLYSEQIKKGILDFFNKILN